jgi:hypothetical protein
MLLCVRYSKHKLLVDDSRRDNCGCKCVSIYRDVIHVIRAVIRRQDENISYFVGLRLDLRHFAALCNGTVLAGISLSTGDRRTIGCGL